MDGIFLNLYQWIFLIVFSPHVISSQVTINVTSLETEPYLFLSDKNDSSSYEGYIPDLLDRLTKLAGYSYNLKLVPDNKYGSFDENGSWDGLVGELVNNRTDMVAAPLTVTALRANVVDFSHPFQSLGPVIILKRPDKMKPALKESLTKLLVPLEFSVWLMSILAFFATGTTLYIISYFNPYEWRRMAKDREATLREAESFTCLNSFWFVISTMAWQGYMRTPRSMGGRITTTAWWFFVVILIVTYTASLTNFLRVGPAPDEVEKYSRIRSFSDLASNQDMTIGVLKDGSTSEYFRTSQSAIERGIYEKMQKNPENSFIKESVANGVEKVRNSPYADFAFIMESAMAKYFIQKQPCDLYIVSEHLVNRHYSLAFQAGANELREKINFALLQMQGSGQLRVLENKWFSGLCKETVVEYSEDFYRPGKAYSLDLGSFSGALLILAVGIAFGALVTLIEIAIYKWAEAHPEEDQTTVEAVPMKRASNAASEDNTLLDVDPPVAERKGGATQV